MMKQLRLLMVVIALMMVTVAMATEPSKITVKYQGKKYYVHQVKEGDTLYSISKVYGVSQEVIVEVNDIEGTEIKLGASIFVPVVEKTITGNKEHNKSSGKQQDGYIDHVVKPGETLYSLSRTYGMTEEELLSVNGLKDYTDIKAGMTLKVKKTKGKDKQKLPESHSGSSSSRSKNDGVMYGGKNTHKQSDKADEQSGGEDVITEDILAEAEVAMVDREMPQFAVVEPNAVLRVTLLLPFTVDGAPKDNIVDFYRGVLLAMEDLKAEGRSIELTVLNSKGNATAISQMILFGGLQTQLIIGPVYEPEFASLLGYAEQMNIPVISPLQPAEYSSPVLFNMPASANAKHDKVETLLDASREVVYIFASSNDNAFVNEVRTLSTATAVTELNFKFDRGSFFYHRNTNGTNGAEVNIEEFMRTKSNKTFVVVASQETDVDRILTTLSSTKASIRGRGLTYGNYVTYGNSKWLRMNNLDHDIFYHNDVIFAVSYYANRIEEPIRLFDGRFVGSYGVLPTRNAYRGYDAAIIFCNAMFEGFDSFLDVEHKPLTTPYRFERINGTYVNKNWMRQHYRHDMKIVIE